TFVVVARVVVATIRGPMLGSNLLNALLASRENVQPQQDGPQAILFAHMTGTGAGALLTADCDEIGIEQIAEELPAGWRLIKADAELLRHPVGGAAGGHRAGNALQTAAVAGSKMRVRGKHGQRI